MRVFQNLSSLVILFCLNTALPVGEDNDNGDNNGNVFQLGAKAYGLLKNETGKVESTWNKSSFMNFEETYVRGDIPQTNNVGRNGIVDESKHWYNGIVPYRVVGPYDAVLQEWIKLAMETIELWTCVRFVPYNGERDYIAIESPRSGGCNSEVGRIGGRQVVNLEGYKCFDKIGTAIHELLHVLGIIHEHARPDRDKYVNIYRQNMNPAKKDKYDRNFAIFTLLKTDDFGVPYDFNSIMHYKANSSSFNGQKTIEPKYGDYTMGQRAGLSVRDAVKIMNMYHCYYKIDNHKHASRILPNAHEINGSKSEALNTYFRNFNYTP